MKSIRPAAGDGDVGDRDIHPPGGGRIHEIGKCIQPHVPAMQAKGSGKRVPQFDRHAGMATVHLHHEGRAQIDAYRDWNGFRLLGAGPQWRGA